MAPDQVPAGVVLLAGELGEDWAIARQLGSAIATRISKRCAVMRAHCAASDAQPRVTQPFAPPVGCRGGFPAKDRSGTGGPKQPSGRGRDVAHGRRLVPGFVIFTRATRPALVTITATSGTASRAADQDARRSRCQLSEPASGCVVPSLDRRQSEPARRTLVRCRPAGVRVPAGSWQSPKQRSSRTVTRLEVALAP